MSDAAFTNRLIDSTSPYLLQHAHNPVEWFPWGEDAMEKSRREGKPIFLSIGYSACHWCHVMEHQSFENAAIAAVMNEHFVNIKVDREERPDLDELYMLATQLMTGQGGWPMSVWLTPSPELEPFYAGTYFPPEDGYGRPGFPRLLQGLAEAWRNRRGDLMGQAKKVVEAIKMHADEGGAGGTVDGAGWLQLGLEHQEEAFDEVNGGMGGAPKFPPHQAVGLWVHLIGEGDGRVGAAAETDRAGQKAAPQVGDAARTMLVKTLDGMMRGGIYDHVGGGFARYSTDARWHVPHFEKMLYDTAQLAPSYAVASVRLGREDYGHVARESLDFFLREMCSPAGGFYSSLDADSAGEEGLYYVWTVEDVKGALGDEADAALVMQWLEVKQKGNWDESPVADGNVLEMAVDVEELRRRHGLTAGEMRKRLDGLLKKMRAYRERRQRPGMDDKILTSWNGLMISALAICGRVMREPKYLEAAHRAMGFLLTKHMEGGRRLLRVSRNDVAHVDAFLDDHAYLLNGLMDLIDSTLPASLPGTMARKRALELADVLIAEFEDKKHGGFFFTSARHEKLFARMKNAADNATPSANGVAIRALLRLARVSGKEKYREVALRAVVAFAANIARRPEWFSTIVLALAEDGAAEARVGSVLPVMGGMQAKVDEPVILRLSVEKPGMVRAGEFLEVKARLVIAEGYHIQPREPMDKEAYGTIVHLRGELAVEGEVWTLPAAAAVKGGGTGHAGKMEMRVRWQVPMGTKAGEYAMRVSVLAQACTGSTCLPPERAGAGFRLVVTG